MLDKSDIVDYIYSMVRNMEDEMLIERYISLARRPGVSFIINNISPIW